MTDLPAAATMSAEAATTLVDGIRSSFEQAWASYADGCRLLVEAHRGRAWEALGLSGWAEFVSHTLDVEHLKIPKAERRAIVAALRDGGLSVREIAAATGLGVGTVHRELPASVPDGTPTADPLDGLPDQWGLARDREERQAVHSVARVVLRNGEESLGLPPPWWKPADGTPLREGNRLAEWHIRVLREAGGFLRWCKGAGIVHEAKGLRFPDRLRYPLVEGETLPEDFGPDDEHFAALGHFWFWWYTDEELGSL